MAFNFNKITTLGGQGKSGDSFQTLGYISDDDISVITSVGYFNELIGKVSVNDIITVEDSVNNKIVNLRIDTIDINSNVTVVELTSNAGESGLPEFTSNQTYYVNGTTGSDTNDGLTSGTAFATTDPLFGASGLATGNYLGNKLVVNFDGTNAGNSIDSSNVTINNCFIEFLLESGATSSFDSIAVNNTGGSSFSEEKTILNSSMNLNMTECLSLHIKDLDFCEIHGGAGCTDGDFVNIKNLILYICGFTGTCNIYNCACSYMTNNTLEDVRVTYARGTHHIRNTSMEGGSFNSGFIRSLQGAFVTANGMSTAGTIDAAFYADSAQIIRDPGDSISATTLEQKYNGGQIFS